ncbi:MAG: hypothetical protein GEU78_17505 [Actinobacteria bacterium]|nr:hypothetical protein [Actinomycetota bacterium]
MDALDLPTLIPSASVLGLLLVLVVHTQRQAGADRNDYRSHILSQRESHSKEIAVLRAELGAEIAGLRAEVRELREQNDAERHARWAAEDAAAHWRRRAGVGDD